ncbi:MAG TPA: hypothetical protein VIY69_18025 [Candidatus Acidoferrales bacterium]
MSFDGSDDCVARDRGFGASLEDSIKAEPHAFPADIEEAEGMCMAVKRYFRDSVCDAYRSGGAPEDEVFLDRFAVRVVTYLAFASVALYGGRNADGWSFWFWPLAMLRLDWLFGCN